jgi:hypothetical protein
VSICLEKHKALSSNPSTEEEKEKSLEQKVLANVMVRKEFAKNGDLERGDEYKERNQFLIKQPESLDSDSLKSDSLWTCKSLETIKSFLLNYSDLGFL